MSWGMFAQKTLEVKGTVTSEGDNEPLPGVNVIIEGTDDGTQTDFEGNYVLEVEQGSVLEFSFIGFETKKVPLEDDKTVDVKLAESSEELGEVVIGYGKQRKEDLTGSVGVVEASDIKDIPTPAVDERLAGKLPGVQINSVTGTPGGSSKIEIRGTGSIGASSDPLIVVDGIPIGDDFGHESNPLNLINPNDIKDISVLKDASSTAIYGSRGANGVLLIETEKGSKGKLQFNLSTNAGFQEVPEKGRPDFLTAKQFAEFQKEMREDKAVADGKSASDADIPEMYQNPDKYGEGTDWYETILRDAAPTEQINFNVKGGSEDIKAFMSLGYFDQDGVVKHTGYERYSLRTNIEADIRPDLKVGLNVSSIFSKQEIANTESDFVDIIGSSQWMNPIESAYNEEGDLNPFIGGAGLFEGANPLLRLKYEGTNAQDFRGIANTFVEYEILEGLKTKFTYSADYGSGKESSFHPSFVGNTNDPPPTTATHNVNRHDRLNQYSELLLTYEKDFNEDHSIDVTAGWTTQKERVENLNINGREFGDDLVHDIGDAGRITDYGEDVGTWSLNSYFGRFDYNFRDKYLISGTIRADGSSRFGSDNRYGVFPSIGVAWRVSDEPFMKNGFFDDLKIKGSYGLTGNFSIGNYTHIGQMVDDDYVLGGNRAFGRSLSNLPNRDLSWEKSAELNLGVESAFLKNRLYLDVGYYRRTTNNMLLNRELPASSGFTEGTVNAGKILNQGVEININSDNLTGDFRWSTNFNISFNRNKVLELAGDKDRLLSGLSGGGDPTHITEVGEPIGRFFGFVKEGIYKDQDELDNSPSHSTSVPGSVKYKDVDGNGKIEKVKDFDVIGDPNPDFTFGITNTFNYKNFDLNIVIDGQYGSDALVFINQTLDNIDGVFNVTTKVLDRWRSPEDPGNEQVPTTNGGRPLYRDINSSWAEDNSFLRFRNISLGYDFTDLIGGEFIEDARVHLSVQNAFLFTKYSRSNPQVQNTNNFLTDDVSTALTPGTDYTSYPLARTYSIGLDFSF